MLNVEWKGREELSLVMRALIAVCALAAMLAYAPVTWAKPPVERYTSAPAASEPGYTLHYSFSSDPNNSAYVASFTPDVKAIYAWGTLSADNGAPEKQAMVDIRFYAPDGTPVASKWFGQDTGTVTSFPAGSTSFGPKNVARRELDVAGTDNALRTGQWAVTFSQDGRLVSTGNFTLAGATDLGAGDAASDAKQTLTDAGYDVVDYGETTSDEGKKIAIVVMNPISKDLYSSETSQQVVDGFAALRRGAPQAEDLLVFLATDPRYEVLYYAAAGDFDAYLQSNDFNGLADKIGINVYDKQDDEYLGSGALDFIDKNFGAGSAKPPGNAPLSKTTNVGSVWVEISPSTLPADGKSTAQVKVTVYDKRNKPLPDAEVSFEVTGSGDGSIRPRVTSTDADGAADATFTAGKQNGTATIAAKVGTSTGTGVIEVGRGSGDDAQDNVISFLAAQSYSAVKAGYIDDTKTSAAVIVDLGSTYDINDVRLPILYGMIALRTYYPDATTLAVMIPYQNDYFVFPSLSGDYDKFEADMNAATTDADKKKVIQDYLDVIYNEADVIDSEGNVKSSYKDFYNKNFGGG